MFCRSCRLGPLSVILAASLVSSALADNPETSLSTAPAPSAGCAQQGFQSASELRNLTGGTVTAESVDRFLAERMEALNIPGASVAVINNKKVVYHRAIGEANTSTQETVTPCSIFQGASITKPLFGFFVMTFVEEGLLDLDRPLHEYLPNPAIAHDERYKLITARLALSHQTGLPNWRTDFEDNQLFLQFEPGTGFSYSGEAYQYLSLALQEIAGVDHAGLEALFQERIAQPLGLTHTQIVPSGALLSRRVSPHVDGAPVRVFGANSYEDFGAAYGVHSEAGDFSKWLIGLMEGEVLSDESYRTYFAPQNVPVPSDGNPLILSQDYALGFATFETPLGKLHVHNGNNPGFSSAIAIEKDQGWGIVVFTNANQTSDFGLELMLFLNGVPPVR